MTSIVSEWHSDQLSYSPLEAPTGIEPVYAILQTAA